MAQQVIEADLKSAFKKVTGWIGRMFQQSLKNCGKEDVEAEPMPTSKEEKAMDIRKLKLKLGNGKNLFVQMSPPEKEDRMYNVEVFDEDGNLIDKKDNVRESKFDEYILDKVIDGKLQATWDEEAEWVEESRRLDVKLSKITSSTGVDIVLNAIKANYSPSEVLSDLSTLVSDDEFVSSIPDEGCCYTATPQGEDILVEETEDVQTDEMYKDILTYQANLCMHLQAIHWNAKGDKFYDIHNIAESLLYTVRYQMDTVAELFVEKFGYAPNPATLIYNEGVTSYVNGIDGLTASKAIHELCKEYAALLECYVCNFDADVQTIFNSYIRDIKTQVEYKLSRYMM